MTASPSLRPGTSIADPANPNNAFVPSGSQYETVAASQSDQALGTTGAKGDFLAGLLLVPASVDAGAVTIKDGSGSAITVFAGGTGSVGSLVPFYVPVMAKSAAGAWSVTTGAGVSAIATGSFT